VTDTIEYEQFDQAAQPSGSSSSEADMSRLSDIPMELSVEIGRTHMTVGETLELRVGSVVTLERLAGEPVDLLVNGTAIARGEVIVVEEQFGMRITEILDSDADPLAAPGGAAGASAGGSGAPSTPPESSDAGSSGPDAAAEESTSEASAAPASERRSQR
jgi:flagellar motor switch protein FliN/FliY